METEIRPSLLMWCVILLLVLYIATNGTQPVQQQAPSYNGNSWQTITITEDNDTNTSICAGWCPDY